MSEGSETATEAVQPDQSVMDVGSPGGTQAEPSADSSVGSAEGAEKPGGSAMESSLLSEAAGEEAESSQEAEMPEEAPESVKEGAPEQYEEFTAPEGTKIDAGVSEAFKAAAKELNLSQKAAQGLIDRLAPVLASREREQVMAVNAQWIGRSKKDKEISAGMADIARLRDMFGVGADGKVDPDVAELARSPMGNHPGLLKLLARAGKAFGEAGYPSGKPVARRLTADDVYGNFSER